MRNKLPYIVVSAIVFAVAMLAVYAQDGSGDRKQLSFSVRPLQERVLPLETIGLRFTLANQTSEKLKVRGAQTIEALTLEIKKPNGETVPAGQLSRFIGHVVPNEKTLEPGRTSVWDEKLSYRLNDIFGEVGEYQLRATFQNGDDQVLTSDWVSLIVALPEGDDLLAYEKIKSIPQFRDGKYTMGFDPEANQRAFIEQFPNSKYADHFRYKLAVDLSNTDPTKALEYFEAVAEKPEFVFAEDAKAKVKELREQKEKARDLEERRKAKAKPVN